MYIIEISYLPPIEHSLVLCLAYIHNGRQTLIIVWRNQTIEITKLYDWADKVVRVTVPLVFTDTFSAIVGIAMVRSKKAIDVNFMINRSVISITLFSSVFECKNIKKSNTFQYFFDLFSGESRKGQKIDK